MRLTPLRGAGLLAGFVLLLLFLTLVSTPAPPPSGAEHDARGAERECLDEVRERVQGARFPFGANVTYLGDARYRLQGTVESEIGGETVRRNYECLVGYAGGGGYRADSVRVWQSH